MAPIRVFISYSHEDDDHNTNVLNLAAKLREDGINAWLDRYDPHPPQGWPRWMTQQIEQADYVLLVCTDTYRRRFEGTEEEGKGLGATWEGLVANQVLSESGTKNKKLIPVQLHETPDAIPLALRGYTRYTLLQGYDSMYRHLTQQPEVVPPPVNPSTRDLSQKHDTTPVVAIPKESSLPKADASCSGLPDALWGEPVFFPGMPITAHEHFFGRTRELEAISHSLSQCQPIQLIGEQRMGKTSLLNRIDCDAILPRRPKVRLNGQSHAGKGPYQFICAIAEALGQKAAFHSGITDHDNPNEKELLAALGALGEFTLLLDEADELTRDSHEFTDGILNQCRALCESGQICWISASRNNLHGAFQQTGLSSDFLNNSRAIYVGQLDHKAARSLLSVLGEASSEHIISQAGGFAHGLQVLADSCWRRTLSCTDELLSDRFANAMSAIFKSWWSHRTELEQRLLLQATTPISVEKCPPIDRRKLRCLVDLGLVSEHNGIFELPGAAWREYIIDAR